MIFWLITILFTFVITLIGFYPLLKKSQNHDDIQRDTLNKSLYFARLKETEKEISQGLLDNPEQTQRELQQTLLEDIPENIEYKKIGQKAFSKWAFVVVFLSLFVISAITYSSVGAWKMQEMMAESTGKLDYFYKRLQEEETKPLTEAELEQFAVALRAKLQDQANDHKGWWLLGQIGLSIGDYNLAETAYQKAFFLKPDDIDYKLSYARILMYSQDEVDKQKGETYLKDVIRQDHSNIQALSMLALHYFEQEDYNMAIVTWNMMLKLLPENDSRRGLLENSIRSAKNALNGKKKLETNIADQIQTNE